MTDTAIIRASGSDNQYLSDMPASASLRWFRRRLRDCCCECSPIRACLRRKSALTWYKQLRDCVVRHPKVVRFARRLRHGALRESGCAGSHGRTRRSRFA